MFLASLPHRDACVHVSQALETHYTWSNTKLMALVQTHTCLIHSCNHERMGPPQGLACTRHTTPLRQRHALAPVHTDYSMHLKDCNRSVRALPPTRFYASTGRAGLHSVNRKVFNWTPLAWLNSLSYHTGFSTSVDFNIQQSEGDEGLDIAELPTTGAAHPAPENVQSSRMHMQTLCYRQIRGSPSLLHAAHCRHNRST